jgi:hydrogenase nickel incorporation protein HypB
MCTTCGCSDQSKPRLTDLQTGALIAIESERDDPRRSGSDHSHAGHHHHHHHDHEHGHNSSGHAHHDHHHHHDHDDGHSHEPPDHAHTHRQGTTITLEADVLAKNNRLAERNRGWLAGRNILALNLVSAPGSGKTTILERTIRALGSDLTLSVIEGDQETVNDARRIQATGCRVVQINTGTGCHLDAAMVARGLQQLDSPTNSVLFIENVGNLVCPALFDLGERVKVAIVSVTEGEDKPLKYPHMFRASEMIILNKMDLLPYVPFDLQRFLEYVERVNPGARVVQVSALREDGMADWYDWIRAHVSAPSPI